MRIHVHQERLSFRALRLLLSLDKQWLGFLAGITFFPIMLIPDTTVQILLFFLYLWGLMWLGAIPRYQDGRESAEKYFISKGRWIYRDDKRVPR